MQSYDTSVLITTIAGVFAMLSALFLALTAKALSPEMKVFPCVNWALRLLMGVTATGWFLRGASLLTSLRTDEPRLAHIDVLIGWVPTTLLVALIFVGVLRQRAPVGVWPRLHRARAFKLARIRGLAKHGRSGLAVAQMVADDEPFVMAQMELPADARPLAKVDDGPILA
jgi:hypothetical protein